MAWFGVNQSQGYGLVWINHKVMVWCEPVTMSWFGVNQSQGHGLVWTSHKVIATYGGQPVIAWFLVLLFQKCWQIPNNSCFKSLAIYMFQAAERHVKVMFLLCTLPCRNYSCFIECDMSICKKICNPWWFTFDLLQVACSNPGWSKIASMKGHITVWGKICGPQREELTCN